MTDSEVTVTWNDPIDSKGISEYHIRIQQRSGSLIKMDIVRLAEGNFSEYKVHDLGMQFNLSYKIYLYIQCNFYGSYLLHYLEFMLNLLYNKENTINSHPNSSKISTECIIIIVFFPQYHIHHIR